MKCNNCGTEIKEEDSRICYTCNHAYCIWCASDNLGSHIDINCQTGIDNGIPF
jgi:hypothetical protein